ncbi:MAG: bifunctional isocitrate dehydrogenase kinase/phosphatase, partial [Gammaproteobacteria bacterium]|nr:bifunctional isocitrate dehydrogenase kinase/phosphatase [Gammaproteobacteria bacterium]
MNDSESRALAVSTWLYEEYSLFYQEFLKILDLAKIAFEKRDFSSSVRVSARRLSLYSLSIVDVSDRLKQAYPEIHDDEAQWQAVESQY